MGVSRLWSHVTRNKAACFERIDLVQIARSRLNAYILVDFYSWEQYIKNSFAKSVSFQVGHPYLIFDGGEYSLIDTYIRNFVLALRNVGIELVFYLDGAKGSSLFATEQKWTTWQNRYAEDGAKLHDFMEFFRGKLPFSRLDMDKVVRPCLQEIQNLLTLQSLGCSLNQCVAGEADSFLAQHMVRDKNAIAIFSNDTDFCIFPGCVLLQEHFFDIRNDLRLGPSSLAVSSPSKLICDVISSDRLWKFFGFSGVEALAEFSILRGNDFTSPFLREFGPMVRLETAVEMIKQHGKAENCPCLEKLLANNPPFRQAVEHSRKFYAMELGEEIDDCNDESFDIIISKVRRCIYPSSVIAMWKSFYWHRLIMEEPCHKLVPAEEALIPLRAFVYSILLPPDRHLVREYGRSQANHFDEFQVYKVYDSALPNLPTINTNSFNENLHVFEHIMSHQELLPDYRKEISFFKLYGVKQGFVYCLLRYFLLLNWYQNLFLRPREFQALFAWIMGEHDVSHYRSLKIVPSPRCITIENWFLLLFRLTHAFLGNVLNLSQAFPTPAELFSGATWVALYTSIAVTDPSPAWAEPPPLSVPAEVMADAAKHVSEVVQQNSEPFSLLTENVF